MTDRKDDRLWGGRFEDAPDADFDAFQRSFSFDSRFLLLQLKVDRAWARGTPRRRSLDRGRISPDSRRAR